MWQSQDLSPDGLTLEEMGALNSYITLTLISRLWAGSSFCEDIYITFSTNANFF